VNLWYAAVVKVLNLQNSYPQVSGPRYDWDYGIVKASFQMPPNPNISNHTTTLDRFVHQGSHCSFPSRTIKNGESNLSAYVTIWVTVLIS
jgi:hypothetical protein